MLKPNYNSPFLGVDKNPLGATILASIRSSRKDFAFTLAEVLITLGIIGIVAAMVIPSLLSSYKKRYTETRLKKAFAVMAQLYKLSYNDLGDPGTQYKKKAKEYTMNYFVPYMNVAKVCTTYKDCGYQSLTPFLLSTGKRSDTKLFLQNTRQPLYDNQNILYVIFTATTSQATPTTTVMVDINRGDKPNMIGNDVFLFTRKDDGTLAACGYELSDSEIKDNCKTKGSYCAELIRRNNWKIPNDYPIKF